MGAAGNDQQSLKIVLQVRVQTTAGTDQVNRRCEIVRRSDLPDALADKMEIGEGLQHNEKG